jgi:acyl-CoA thioesterase II
MSSDACVRELLDCLDLERIEQNIFRGRNESERPGRLFGGQVAAQSLVAAGRTLPETKPAHSLHGYFLRPGDPTCPVLYSVDRIRDGRSFTTRRVVARQRGKAIFNMSVSFHASEPGYEHQFDRPAAPEPEAVPTWSEHIARSPAPVPEELRNWVARPHPIDVRHVEAPIFLGGRPASGPCLVWMRAAARLPDDPFVHQCVLTYASDIALLDTIVRPHGAQGPLGPLTTASLDHALWFHRPLRVDEWFLFVQDSPAAFGARGFGRGSLYTRAGALSASVAQEGLLRPTRTSEDRSR